MIFLNILKHIHIQHFNGQLNDDFSLRNISMIVVKSGSNDAPPTRKPLISGQLDNS